MESMIGVEVHLMSLKDTTWWSPTAGATVCVHDQLYVRIVGIAVRSKLVFLIFQENEVMFYYMLCYSPKKVFYYAEYSLGEKN